jgi:hypothetical protein
MVFGEPAMAGRKHPTSERSANIEGWITKEQCNPICRLSQADEEHKTPEGEALDLERRLKFQQKKRKAAIIPFQKFGKSQLSWEIEFGSTPCQALGHCVRDGKHAKQQAMFGSRI